MFVLKLSLIGILLLIFYQDSKDRMVHWFLYPILALLAFYLQYDCTNFQLSVFNALFNLTFVLMLVVVCYFYARFKIKKPFFKDVFGVGDLLFFICIAFTFSILSFFVLFIFAMMFSLILHLYLKRDKKATVPLAGYMALFFAFIYIFSFFAGTTLLYAY